MSIKTKLIVFFTIVAIISIAVSTGVFLIESRNALKSRLVDQLSGVAVNKSQALKNFIEEKSDNLVRIAGEETVMDYKEENVSRTSIDRNNSLREYLEEYIGKNNFIELFLLNEKGLIIISTDEVNEGKIQNEEGFFIKGIKSLSVDSFHFSTIVNQSSMIIATPLKTDTGSVSAVLAGRISLQKISELMNERAGLGETGETILVDKSNLLISESRFIKDIAFKKYIYTKATEECLKKIDGYGEFSDYRGVPVVSRYIWLEDENACLIAKMDQSEAYKSMKQLERLTIMTMVIVLLIVIIVSILFSLSITRPIQKLLEAAQEIARGNYEYRILKIPHNDETGKLSMAFNSMADAIKKSREDVDRKVIEQTSIIRDKSEDLEKRQKAMINILEDVDTEKKKVEQIAVDLEKFKMAVENASDHIVITDAEGMILYANKAVEKITGFAPSTMIGKKAGNEQLWGGEMEDSFYAKLWKTIKEDKVSFSGEINNKRKNGEKYVALANISPILNNIGEVAFFIGIERDITREKEIDRMKTDFISLASHQLRTPLSAMKWFGEMLLDGDAGALTKEQKEFVENIHTSNERLIELVNSLLNISRIESGRLMIDPKPTNIKELIESVVGEVQNQMNETKQACIISINENLPLIKLDPKLIRQVYMNLLTNAIKYTPKEGEIQIFVSKKDNELLSQISDNGYGIPKEEQGKIFQRFFRAKNIVKMETEGTGLGLYLIKAIVESSGGKIWFTSSDDEAKHGSTFWFTIPLTGMEAKKGEVGLEEKMLTKAK